MAKKCESNDICSGMLDLLVSRGVVEDKRIVNPKARLDKQKRNQMAYHNTELLLKHADYIKPNVMKVYSTTTRLL